MANPVYLDCNATTPLEPEVKEVLLHYLEEDFGNEGSRTHEYGARAKQAVQKARDEVGSLVGATRDEVLFTSGATESNNLAILGLMKEGQETGRRHIISSKIEHKAVLEPLEFMEKQGFEVTLLEVGESGAFDAKQLADSLRPETLLVSLMQVNNETGVRQPLQKVTEVLEGHEAWFHTDAAQGYGKDLETLKNSRIDLISVSGHKLYAPKGVGALISRRRGYERAPLSPLTYGGGQERGVRPGTLPVALIAALGKAAELAGKENNDRLSRCAQIKEGAISAFSELSPRYHGDQSLVMGNVLNMSFGELDSEALMVALKDLVAISNGSACTSASYTPSHVLKAMGLDDDEANTALRFSWCHLTPDVDWTSITKRIKRLLT